MLRDYRKNKDYFDEAIEVADSQLDFYGEAILSPEKLNPYGRMGMCIGLYKYTMEKLHLLYSRGEDFMLLKNSIEKLSQYKKLQNHYADLLPPEYLSKKIEWEKLSFDNLKHYLTWLSFAVNLNFDKEHFREILTLIDNKGLDALFDTIAFKLGDTDRPKSQKILYPKPYGLLLDAINASTEQQPKLMIKFLEVWYPACVKQGFFNTHEIKNDVSYYGYWCFEAALVVKLFNIDDSSFRDHQYYPAALVHGD